jgi:hypothetical protein
MLTMPIIDRKHGGRRDNRANYLTPMGERWAGHTGDLVTDLVGLVQWMDVENSLRWASRRNAKGKLATYCDHYAADFTEQLLGKAVLPAWTWWLDDVLEDHREGEDLPDPVIGKTVREFGARSLHAWLPVYGADFGWRAEKDMSGLVNTLNAGPTFGIITTPKHIAIALPDACGALLDVPAGSVVLSSQAGSRNVAAWRQDDWFRRNKARQFHSFNPST